MTLLNEGQIFYFRNLSVLIYVVGLFFWYYIWGKIIGYDWLRKERLLHIPFWMATIAFLVNIILAMIAEIPEYAIEIGIYSFVETNATTVAAFVLGIAVFVVLRFEKVVSTGEKKVESRMFLQLLFWAFLIAVLGVLPLYWVPQVFGWLTILRHLKTVPTLYATFLIASAIIIFLRELRMYSKEKDLFQE